MQRHFNQFNNSPFQGDGIQLFFVFQSLIYVYFQQHLQSKTLPGVVGMSCFLLYIACQHPILPSHAFHNCSLFELLSFISWISSSFLKVFIFFTNLVKGCHSKLQCSSKLAHWNIEKILPLPGPFTFLLNHNHQLNGHEVKEGLMQEEFPYFRRHSPSFLIDC